LICVFPSAKTLQEEEEEEEKGKRARRKKMKKKIGNSTVLRRIGGKRERKGSKIE
jgi:hypothetical protein